MGKAAMHVEEIGFDADVEAHKWETCQQIEVATHQQRPCLDRQPRDRMLLKDFEAPLAQAGPGFRWLIGISCGGHKYAILARLWPTKFGLEDLHNVGFQHHPGAPWGRAKSPHGTLAHIAKRAASPAEGTAFVGVERVGESSCQKAPFLGGQCLLDHGGGDLDALAEALCGASVGCE
jgi:hypothetical protein